MCAMTGLNIQSLVLLEDGVIIWQVFIRILRYYGTKLTGRIVKIFPLPSPPPREEACSRKSYLRSNNCHCERQNRASQSHNLYNINEITTSNALHSPRNDIENLCKTQYVGWSGTLPCNDRTNSCKAQVVDGTATFPLSLCVREQLLTSERVIRDAGDGLIRGHEASEARGQAYLEDRKVRRYEDRLFTVKSLSSYPPTLLSSDNPLPQSLPQGREAEKRAAFTLAEVLITLGIIGVVAAMTMPSLIQNYQKKQTVVQLKKVYNVIANALQFAKSEHGDTELWEIGSDNNIQASSDFASEYLIPYLNVIKTCGTDSSGGCAYELKTLSDADFTSLLTNSTRFILNDGTLVFVSTSVNPPESTFPKLINIDVDINGFKRPNKMGRDYFRFAVALETTQDMYKPTGRLNASGQSQTRETITGSDTSSCSKGKRGDYCAALIMHDNWEITKDYPW